jgi:hypothetical protein
MKIRQNGDTSDDALNLEVAIRQLRDEVTVYLMQLYKGNSRTLAMVLTKLDEAEMWAVRHGMDTGRLVTVDRAELLQAARDA